MAKRKKLKQILDKISTPVERFIDAVENDEVIEREKAIEAYKAIATPEEKVMDFLENIDLLKGKDGVTPTQEELQELIKPLIKEPANGKDGKDGESIVGPRGEPGKDGNEFESKDIIEKMSSIPDGTGFSVLKLRDLEWLKGKKGMNWSSAGFKVYTGAGLTGDGSFANPLVNSLDLTGYLKLDQTTPQTIINGSPLLTGFTPTSDYQIATKKYVDDSVSLENLWDRDSVNGYLYPHTLTDKVGIGTATPAERLDLGSGNFATTGKGYFGDKTLATQGVILNDTSYAINATGNVSINGRLSSPVPTMQVDVSLDGSNSYNLTNWNSISVSNDGTGNFVGLNTYNALDVTGTSYFADGPNYIYFTNGTYAISATGNVQLNSLTASKAIYTDANSVLTTTAPTSGALGYWSRTGTTITPATTTDYVTHPGGLSVGTTLTNGYITIANLSHTIYLGSSGYGGYFVNKSTPNSTLYLAESSYGIRYNDVSSTVFSVGTTGDGYFKSKVGVGGSNRSGNAFTVSTTAIGGNYGARALDLVTSDNATANSAINWVNNVGTVSTIIGRNYLVSNSILEILNGTSTSALLIDSLYRFGFGISPTAKIHLPAGTNTINPLNFTAGIDLSTTKDGAFEYDGTKLHFTNSGLQRRTLTTEEYVGSRQQNLITNGSGLMNDNTNFSAFTFDKIETHGGGGSFSINSKGSPTTDEFLPVDITKNYRLIGWAKSGDTGGANYVAANNQYYGVATYDIDGGLIPTYAYLKYTGSTDTTLAVQLNPGDTTMTVTNATGWSVSANWFSRHFVWYPYTNAKGYSYPNYTYSKNGSRLYSQYTNYGAWGIPTTGIPTPVWASADSSLSRASGSFIQDGLKVGNKVNSTNASNPGPLTIATVADLKITFVEAITNSSTATVCSYFLADGITPLGVNTGTGVIQLTTPWVGPVVPAGAAVRNGNDGGTYKYIALGGTAVPNDWTRYEGYIGGIDTNGTGAINLFNYGTAFVKVLFLTNYQGGTSNIIRWSDMSFSELSAVNLESASATQIGVVNLSNQSMGAGDKYFSGKIGAGITNPTNAISSNGSADFLGSLGIGFNGAPADKLHIIGSNTNTATNFGGTMGILLRNTNNTVGNYSSITNQDSDATVNSGIYFKNVDHAYAGRIDFITRSAVGEYGIRATIDEFGKFGIGTLPSAKAHILSTTEQLRLGYDASNYLSATVGSTGSITLALTGTTPTFTFSQDVVVPDLKATTYHVGADAGVDGTFTTVDLKTVTVKKGIITSIV